MLSRFESESYEMSVSDTVNCYSEDYARCEECILGHMRRLEKRWERSSPYRVHAFALSLIGTYIVHTSKSRSTTLPRHKSRLCNGGIYVLDQTVPCLLLLETRTNTAYFPYCRRSFQGLDHYRSVSSSASACRKVRSSRPFSTFHLVAILAIPKSRDLCQGVK